MAHTRSRLRLAFEKINRAAVAHGYWRGSKRPIGSLSSIRKPRGVDYGSDAGAVSARSVPRRPTTGATDHMASTQAISYLRVCEQAPGFGAAQRQQRHLSQTHPTAPPTQILSKPPRGPQRQAKRPRGTKSITGQGERKMPPHLFFGLAENSPWRSACSPSPGTTATSSSSSSSSSSRAFPVAAKGFADVHRGVAP